MRINTINFNKEVSHFTALEWSTGVLDYLEQGKVKVKLFLCFFLTEHHSMKAYWGVEVKLHTFLTSALDH
jgi:hypothetical protein